MRWGGDGKVEGIGKEVEIGGGDWIKGSGEEGDGKERGEDVIIIEGFGELIHFFFGFAFLRVFCSW